MLYNNVISKYSFGLYNIYTVLQNTSYFYCILAVFIYSQVIQFVQNDMLYNVTYLQSNNCCYVLSISGWYSYSVTASNYSCHVLNVS